MVLASTLVFCVLILSAQAPARGRRGSRPAVVDPDRGRADRELDHRRDLAQRSPRRPTRSGNVFAARSENVRLKKELADKDRELFHLRAEVSQERRASGSLAAAAAVLPNVVGTAPVLLVENRAGLQSALIGAGSTSGVVVGSPDRRHRGTRRPRRHRRRGRSRARSCWSTPPRRPARASSRTGEIGVVKGDGRGGLRLNNIPTTSRVRAGRPRRVGGDRRDLSARRRDRARVERVPRGSGLFLEIRCLPPASFSQLTDVLVLAPSPAVTENPGGARSGTP